MVKNKLISVGLVSPNKVKSQYKPKTKKLTGMLEIYENKNYGAVGIIYYTNSFFGRLREKITKKEQKKYSKRLKKAFDSNKCVDTSKWVKPDEESIRQELIKNLFLIEIFDEESKFYTEAQAKVDVCYSILHSHSPKNPQILGSYGFDGFPFTVITELKGKYKDRRMDCSFIDWKKNKFKKTRPCKQARKMYKNLLKSYKNNMIKINEKE